MKVLFICTANICRSAVAEVVLRAELQALGVESVEVSSAGIRDFSGSNRDETMCRIAADYGYELGGIARQVTREELNASDLVVVMDCKNYVDVQQLMNYDKWNRLHLFLEICFGDNNSLMDPTFDTEERYRQAFLKIQDGCKILARLLK